MTNQQDWSSEEWRSAIREIDDQIRYEVTYAGLVGNIPSVHQHHTQVIEELLQMLAISPRGDDSVIYDFMYIYGTHHTTDEINQYFNITTNEPDAVVRHFVRRVANSLGHENILLARQFLNRVVGLPGDFSRSGYPPFQPHELPPRAAPAPAPTPTPTLIVRRRLSPLPQVASRAPVPAHATEPGTGKVINGFPKPKGQRHVAGPRRRLLCKEEKTTGGRCASLFQGYSDLMRHCRERHGLAPKGDYDVAGCGPFSRTKVQQKRPGHPFPPFGDEKEDEESGGEEEEQEE